jgi:hypothetical protein
MTAIALGTGVGFGIVNNGTIVTGGTGMIEGGHVVRLRHVVIDRYISFSFSPRSINVMF